LLPRHRVRAVRKKTDVVERPLGAFHRIGLLA
jgi:hypothetical protein